VAGEGAFVGTPEEREEAEAAAAAAAEAAAPKEESEHHRALRLMRELARDNPRLAAQIIKDWMTSDE
jgi:flagellar biosynthesis/type III secretory pathway M-ring protein FliF/YscJ